jgi:hypothetical protein
MHHPGLLFAQRKLGANGRARFRRLTLRSATESQRDQPYHNPFESTSSDSRRFAKSLLQRLVGRVTPCVPFVSGKCRRAED